MTLSTLIQCVVVVVPHHPRPIELVCGAPVRAWDFFLPGKGVDYGAAKAGLVVGEDGRAAANRWIGPFRHADFFRGYHRVRPCRGRRKTRTEDESCSQQYATQH